MPGTVNRTVLLFRAMLWIAPPGYAIASLAGWSVGLQRFWFFPGFSPWIWLLSYIAFVIGTGFYIARLSPRRRLRPKAFTRFVVMFCLVHLLLVPLVLAGAAVLYVMKYGIGWTGC